MVSIWTVLIVGAILVWLYIDAEERRRHEYDERPRPRTIIEYRKPETDEEMWEALDSWLSKKTPEELRQIRDSIDFTIVLMEAGVFEYIAESQKGQQQSTSTAEESTAGTAKGRRTDTGAHET